MSDIKITCDQCTVPVTKVVDYGPLIERFGHLPKDHIDYVGWPRWRHDPAAPWGHGPFVNGIAEWYDVPDDAAKRHTRSHTDTAGQLILICANRRGSSRCANRAEFSITTWQTAFDLLDAAHRDEATVADLRAIARSI